MPDLKLVPLFIKVTFSQIVGDQNTRQSLSAGPIETGRQILAPADHERAFIIESLKGPQAIFIHSNLSIEKDTLF